MRRFLFILLLAFFAILSPADAFTVTGGTQEQRTIIREAIQASEFPPVAWVDSRFQGGVQIQIVDHFGTYWDLAGPVELDVFPSIVGAADGGHIYILATLAANTWLAEVATHEWGHEVWFALPTDANREWALMAMDGFPDADPDVWLQSPVENHAENWRVAALPDQWQVNKQPRTMIRRFAADFVREWHAKWAPETTTTTTSLPSATTTTTVPPPPPTTTTTIARGDPWPDVTREDTELWESGWWAKDNNIIYGYADGTFGPYLVVNHRHLSLIVNRWTGLGMPDVWMEDYSPVTRAEVRDALPGLIWLEARWTEPLTRGQLVRLLWRAR